MNNVLKYLGLVFLGILALSLSVMAYGVYRMNQLAGTLIPQLESYTCAQFRKDVENPENTSVLPMAIATVAYGTGELDAAQMEEEFRKTGVIPAISKVYQMCETRGDTRLLDLFAAEIRATTIPQTQPVNTEAR